MKQLKGMIAIWVEVERLKSCNLNQSWMKARWRFERWRFELCQMNSFYESFTNFDVHFLWKCFPELGLFWTDFCILCFCLKQGNLAVICPTWRICQKVFPLVAVLLLHSICIGKISAVWASLSDIILRKKMQCFLTANN